MKTYENLSFWQEDIGAGVTRQPLTENICADVCIIGAGFTGLSTAIHLKEKRPDLNVTVLEADFVGYG
ncbi:MAG: FAD-dependent oxidoreductase, partial [Bacillales bacterium]